MKLNRQDWTLPDDRTQWHSTVIEAMSQLGGNLFPLIASETAIEVARSLNWTIEPTTLPNSPGDCRILIANDSPKRSLLAEGFVLPVKWIQNRPDEESKMPAGLQRIARDISNIVLNTEEADWFLSVPPIDAKPMYKANLLQSIFGEDSGWESAAVPLYVGLKQAIDQITPKPDTFVTGAIMHRTITAVSGIDFKAKAVARHKGTLLFCPQSSSGRSNDQTLEQIQNESIALGVEIKSIPDQAKIKELSRVLFDMSHSVVSDGTISSIDDLAEDSEGMNAVNRHYQWIHSLNLKGGESDQFFYNSIFPAVVKRATKRLGEKTEWIKQFDTLVCFLSQMSQLRLNFEIFKPRNLFLFCSEKTHKPAAEFCASHADRCENIPPPVVIPTELAQSGLSIVEFCSLIKDQFENWKIDRGKTIFDLNSGPTLNKLALLSILNDTDHIFWIEHETESGIQGGNQIHFGSEKHQFAQVGNLG